MIEFALHYARRNWPVFPLAEGDKVPALPRYRGGRGCLDATRDVDRIEGWWRQFPRANVGIATGRPSGLLVIDVDTKRARNWLASLRSLELPQTFTVRTWSGGFHLYFLLSTESRISIGTDVVPGIDWRGTGGYVVGAGSIVNGVPYQIVRNVPIVQAPRALLDRIEAQAGKRRPLVRDENGHMVIPDGRRNDTLFRIGCALRRFGIDQAAITECLHVVNATHCASALGAPEVEQIAASAARYEPVGAAS